MVKLGPGSGNGEFKVCRGTSLNEENWLFSPGHFLVRIWRLSFEYVTGNRKNQMLCFDRPLSSGLHSQNSSTVAIFP